MSLSGFSIRRPVAMSCLFIGLTLLGFNAYRKMGLELMPKIDLPYITIVTVYPGATPEEIETDIAKRIEDEVTSISGLKHVTSTCVENMCQTLLEFELYVNQDIAATDVREKLDLIRDDFPQGVEDPKVVKYDINAKAVLTIALTGNRSIDELFDYADNELRDRLSVLPGVASVELEGGAEREVHILADRNKLAARGLTSLNLVRAIQEGVRTIPSGRIRSHGTEYSVKFDADYKELAAIGDIEVAGKDGQRTYIKDVAEVSMGTGELRQIAHVDGRQAVAIRIIKRSEANAVKVIDAVRGALDRMGNELPGGTELVWVTDDGTFTRAMVKDAWANVGQGILLTGLILFLFLHNFRTTLIIVITMPLTIVIGLFFMHMAGYTINVLTLISLGMSVGILVTNSIVVLEVIVRHLETGLSPGEAARAGAGESFIPVLASAGTNIVVLFPLAMMPGMVGLFVGPFAMTMVIVTAVSLFMSFTLTPMLASLILRPAKKTSRSPLAVLGRLWDRGFDFVANLYKGQLRFFERHRIAALFFIAVIVAIFAHSLFIGKNLGSSMIREADRGEAFVKLEFPTSYDLARTTEEVLVIEERLRSLPHLRHMLTTIGKVQSMMGQTSEGVHLAQILLRFNERTERPETMDDILNLIRERVQNYPGVIATLSVANITGGQESDVEFEISGPDLATLDRLALEAQTAAQNIPGFRDPDTTTRHGKPELRVKPNRAVLADLGFAPTSLGTALRGNIEGITAGTFKREARNYDIVVKFAEEEGKDQVRDFLFPAAPGRPMALETLGVVEESLAPVQITRVDKQRVSKFFGNLAPTLPLGTATARLEAEFIKQTGLPPGYALRFAGIYEVMSEGMDALHEAGLIASLLVILMLAALLESFKQPVLILVTLPLGLIGVLYSLYCGGYSMGIFTMMGIVMLIGIVVNNAILIMDQFNAHVSEGVHRHQAMISAAREELRPIIMITLAAVLGMLPLAFGRGIGAEPRNDVGLASAGGILISGIFTVYVVPILYGFFTRKPKTNKNGSPASSTGEDAAMQVPGGAE
ncbi:MAG TPA: efflux RND transporter permease subunit [Candidatus Hydrogenedentes bacterium]|nr:efflux RND transporter permease subunit [Candidatus Hydrogenedentota bacterium]